MWTSSGATLKRVGVANWYSKQFVCMPAGELSEPFMTDRARSAHISDVGFLAAILGGIYRAADFKGPSLGISGNLNALQWIGFQRAQHGIAMQTIRAFSKRVVKKRCDFLVCMLVRAEMWLPTIQQDCDIRKSNAGRGNLVWNGLRSLA